VDGRKYALKYRDAVASLVVQDVVDKDRGLYTCEASNVHGYATSSAALRITGTTSVLRFEIRLFNTRSPEATAAADTELDMGHYFVTQPYPTQDFPDPTTRPSRDRPMKNIVNLFCVQRIM